MRIILSFFFLALLAVSPCQGRGLFLRYYMHSRLFLKNKTICFAVEESISSPRKDSLNDTKTICFAAMMVYDAFVKRVILVNG